jgi:hypothetical protein
MSQKAKLRRAISPNEMKDFAPPAKELSAIQYDDPHDCWNQALVEQIWRELKEYEPSSK